MELIEIQENGIDMVFGRSERKIYLLHISDRKFDRGLLNDKEIVWGQYRLFEVQVSGKNQSIHRGGKNICSSEGVEADFVDLKDFRNEFGRKIEVVQHSNDTEIISHYQFFNGVKAIKSWTEVKNISTRILSVEHVSSFCLYGLCKECGKENYENLALWQSFNSWYCEGQWSRRMIKEYGVLRVNGLHSMARALVSNTGSWSTKEFLPTGAVENVQTGDIMFWQIETRASWNYEVGACSNEFYVNFFRASGLENQWYKKLQPGEEFISDAAVVAFGSRKIETAIEEMVKYRRIIRRGYKDYRTLPVVYNPYMHDAWDYPYADHMEDVARGAKELGADIFCIDAGWHDEDDFMKYIGAWRESKTRYPLTLCKTLDYIRSLGLKIGLWLEIETFGMDSPLRKIFDSDCFFLRNGEIPINNGRMQLNFSNEKVRKYADEVIDRLMTDYHLDYIKMDYNHDSGAGTEVGSDSFGDGLLKHVRAYRDWLKKVMERYPRLVIENCGSGGLRMDYYHLAEHCICSTSDETDYKKYPYIAANITAAATPEQMGIWCYPLLDCDEEEVIFNVVNSALGRIQLAGGAYRMTGENLALLKEGIAYHREINVDKALSVPFWPLGFCSFGADFAAYGIRTEKKAYLAVWNMLSPKEGVVPLGDRKVKNVKMGYPKNNALEYSFDGKNLRIRFDKEYQARIFELEFEE